MRVKERRSLSYITTPPLLNKERGSKGVRLVKMMNIMTEAIQRVRDEIATPSARNDPFLSLRGASAPKQSQPPEYPPPGLPRLWLAMTVENEPVQFLDRVASDV